MTAETFFTQPEAIRYLDTVFKVHGMAENRNQIYLLNDQRRGRCLNPTPFTKVRNRVLYRPEDLEAWAHVEIARALAAKKAVFEVEGDSELERFVKLSIAVTKH